MNFLTNLLNPIGDGYFKLVHQKAFLCHIERYAYMLEDI